MGSRSEDAAIPKTPKTFFQPERILAWFEFTNWAIHRSTRSWRKFINCHNPQSGIPGFLWTNLIGEGSGSFHDSFKRTKKIILEFIIWQFTLFEVFYWQLTKWIQSKRGLYCFKNTFQSKFKNMAWKPIWIRNIPTESSFEHPIFVKCSPKTDQTRDHCRRIRPML